MEKEFIPYEQALELKELGFNEPCFGNFADDEKHTLFTNGNRPGKTNAPTFSQAFRWFREKYNLFGCIDLQLCTAAHWFIRIDDIIINDYLFHSEDESLKFATYEEAELACLIKLIEIVKKQITMAQQKIECESGVDWLVRNLVSDGYINGDISNLYNKAKQVEQDYTNNEIDNALIEYQHNQNK